MSMTDPIADMLTRIRNACAARKEAVEVPWSKLKETIVRILKQEGFVEDFAVIQKDRKPWILVTLRYDGQNRPVITGLKRVSKPGLRVYVGVEEIPSVRQGLGISILSTPAGVLTDRQARQRRVGGELLCSVW
ncbi:MAG: 30S ribosomal protein S8 [Candidatus Binatia bacterium]|nr:MAG: 30S ribosomal protein S8 [Candidatus Binatia bacterium]